MRKQMFKIAHCALSIWFSFALMVFAAGEPTDNPAAKFQLPWTDQLKWKQVITVSPVAGQIADDAVAKAQEQLLKQGGGVLYFPAGTYQFRDSLKIADGVILRGATPTKQTDARQADYELATKFEFPQYVAKLSGDGTPIDTAFKGIYLTDPKNSNCGVVIIAINRGHIHFQSTPEHLCGRNKIVFGCIFRNAAVADPAVPDAKLGQLPWQRFTQRHHAAVNVHAEENILIANNRLPKSGEDNFTMNGYICEAPNPDKKAANKKIALPVDGVVFDYDNRPGFYINDYGMGAAGGQDPDGNPTDQPWCFRKGIVIVGNYLHMTGRCAISFTGDGTICNDNVIRFEKGIWRPTATGKVITAGSSTNDNRAVQMRGYRWQVNGNDYEVYRNISHKQRLRNQRRRRANARRSCQQHRAG